MSALTFFTLFYWVITLFACFSVEELLWAPRHAGLKMTSSDLTGRRYVCDNEALQFECVANNVARMIWTGSGYIGQQIYFGSGDDVYSQIHKRGATAILTRNTPGSPRHPDLRNLISILTIKADSSVTNGWVKCRTGPGQHFTMRILVSETPHPPDAVNINVTEDGIVLSIHDDIHDSRWELCHYLITVYNEARNVLSRHKLVDTPIIIPEHAGIDSIEAETVTLCHQRSSPRIIHHYNNISNVDNNIMPGKHFHPNGGAQRNLISLPVRAVLVLLFMHQYFSL